MRKKVSKQERGIRKIKGGNFIFFPKSRVINNITNINITKLKLMILIIKYAVIT